MISSHFSAAISSLMLQTFAYLDPGSGSMLFSAIVGIVATIFFVARGVFFRLIELPGSLVGRKSGRKNEQKIAFYSEGGQYWNVFLPLIRELDAREIKCLYLSSKRNDPGLSCNMDNVETRYIGEGNQAFFFLNSLRADICIMTTPGLDVLQIKRSKGVKTYCHITHSAGGCSGYSTYGLDYYDVVLVGGNGDVEMIRELELLRGTKKKRIEIIGCTYLDVLRENRKEDLNAKPFFKNSNKKTILVSPTWGNLGLLAKYGKPLLRSLTRANKYNIIIRPHPQSHQSEADLLERIARKFPSGDQLFWDDSLDGLNAMRQADLMVSDFSGIVFDFLFLFGKPVITFKGQYDKRGKDSMDYSKEPWYISALDKIGNTLGEEDIACLEERIDDLLENQNSLSLILKELREGMDAFPGESGKRGADIVCSIAGLLQK